MTVLGCKWHPSQDNVGICAHCLRESLSKLAVYQDEEDDSIDLENFPPSVPMPMPSNGTPAGSRRAQFILVQCNSEDASRGGGGGGGMAGDNSDLFYPGVNRNAMGALVGGGSSGGGNPYHERADLHLAGVDMIQGDAGVAEEDGSGGGQDEPMGGHHNLPPAIEVGESGRHKRKLHSLSSGRRKPRGWGAAMMKMIGFRSASKKPEASSSGAKPNDHGFDDSDDFASAPLDQQYTPPRFSVSSGLEQTTPARFSVSSLWEHQATSARYANPGAPEQVTPGRYSGASLFDIESMDSRRFSTSSRGSPFTGKKHAVPNDSFNAPWRASKSAANARKMGAYQGFNNQNEPFVAPGKASHSSGTRPFADETPGHYKSPKKSPWKWLSPFKAVTPKEDRKPDPWTWTSHHKKAAVPAAEASPVPDPGFQERRKSTSAVYVTPKPAQQFLTPVLTSKKSPWWRSSPRPRTPKSLKSPATIAAAPKDPELATTDSDLMEDSTPNRRSTASPMVGFSRSSSNGSSCFTTPRWNNRQRPHNSGLRGPATLEKEHEITHLAI